MYYPYLGGILLLREFMFSAMNTRELLQTMRNVDVNVNGWTPLMIAARQNLNSEVIRFLIESGADVGVKNKEGKRALDYAEWNENLKGTDVYNLLRKKRFIKHKNTA